MGTSATTTNTGASVVNAVLKEAVNLGLTALETALATYLPFTALPVIHQIIDAGIDWVGNIIYTAIANEGTFLILKFETSLEKDQFMTAATALRAAQTSGDPNALTQAEKDFAASSSSLIHSDGSSHA